MKTDNQEPFALHQESHLSGAEAVRITHRECKPQLDEFAAAIGTIVPVSNEKAALLLENIIKHSLTASSTFIEEQMRLSHWEESLSAGETLASVADRIFVFLGTENGIRLYNFFVRIFARTGDEMVAAKS